MNCLHDLLQSKGRKCNKIERIREQSASAESPPCFYFWVLSGELVEMCNQVCRWHPCTRWESLIIHSLGSFPELWSSFLSRVCWCLVILAWELGSELWEVSCILINSEYNLLGSLIIFFSIQNKVFWGEKSWKRGWWKVINYRDHK